MKVKKTWIIGIVFIVAAIVALGAALACGAFKKDTWQDINHKMRLKQGLYEQPVQQTMVLDGAVDSLILNTNAEDVTIEYRDDIQKAQITYYDNYEDQVEITYQNNTLSIKRGYKFTWFDISWIFYKDMYDVTVSLPTGTVLQNADMNVASGRLQAEGIQFGNAKLTLGSGSVRLTDCTFQSIESISVSSGSFRMKNCTAADIGRVKLTSGSLHIEGSMTVTSLDSVEMTSGSIRLKGITVNNETALHVTSGSLRIENSSFDALTMSVTSGSIRVEHTAVTNKLFAKVTSGSVRLDKVLAASYELQVGSGSLRISNFHAAQNDVAFSVSVKSGSAKFNSSRLPDGTSGSVSPVCTMDITVSSGSVRVST